VIDTDAYSKRLRRLGLDHERRAVRLAKLRGSEQEDDLTLPPNADGYGRIHHFNTATSPDWPDNPLPIHPAAKALGIDATHTRQAQVFQNAVCNWRCWYCYVPFNLLSGAEAHSDLIPVRQVVDWALQSGRHVLDLSGGQPDLTPEWVLWTLQELDSRDIKDVYVWSDDNLSTDYLYRHLTDDQLGFVARHPRAGRVGCFKGFDADSFAFNTQADPAIFDRQFELMQRHIDHGFDVYAYATFTAQSQDRVDLKMAAFVDRLQAISANLPLRTIPLEVQEFGPVTERLKRSSHAGQALDVQKAAVRAWVNELDQRFSATERNIPICEVVL
jgi:uncharacterized Fe-S cluster-containing radical SAM superfamily protein